MTQKLYLDRSYDTAFEARVLSVRPLPGGARAVVLDRTLFYPESGGQLPDAGELGGARVTDVQETGDEEVLHTVAGEVPDGTTVRGSVDWERRFDHMQQHTGQHVLSRAFIETAGLNTVSFHMGEDTCTIDLEGAGFDEAVVRRAEDVANRVIEENRPVDIVTVPVEALDAADLRRKVPAGVREARIVSVRDFDRIPCCGTHVRATGELGLVKVLRGEKVKSFQRVHFKAGLRALADYREKHAILAGLANRLTTAPSDVPAKVERMAGDAQAAAKREKAMVQRLAALEKSRLLPGAVPAGEHRIVVHRDADAALARALATEFQAEAGVVAILGAADGSVVCATGRGVQLDLAAGVSALARELGGSGGGKGGFAQLRVDPARVDDLVGKVEAHVRSLLA
jgi:alanyl-tRNA synthetase